MPRGDAEVAAGGRLGRDRHRVRELLSRPRRRGDGGRGARPRPAGRGRGDLGLRPQGVREAGHQDPHRRHGERRSRRRERQGHGDASRPGGKTQDIDGRARDPRGRHHRQCRGPRARGHRGEGREGPRRDRRVAAHGRARRLRHRRPGRPALARAQGEPRGRDLRRADRGRERRPSARRHQDPRLHLLPAAGRERRADRAGGQGRGLRGEGRPLSLSSATARRSRSASPRAWSRPSSTPRPASCSAPT